MTRRILAPLLSVTLLIGAGWLAPRQADAVDVVTWVAGGTVAEVTGTMAGTGVEVGDWFEVVYEFDRDSLFVIDQQVIGSESYGMYEALVSIDVTIGSAITASGSGLMRWQVTDNLVSFGTQRGDSYLFEVIDGFTGPGGATKVAGSLVDAGLVALATSDFPQLPPDPLAFPTEHLLQYGDFLGNDILAVWETHEIAAGDTLAPTITSVEAIPNPATTELSVSLEATASDVGTGDSPIAGMDYRLDGGAWQPMAPTDGSFDSPQETGRANIGLLAVGTYQACVRAADQPGNVSAAACTTITVDAANAPPTIDLIVDQQVDELSELRVPVSASDPDGDPVTLSLDSPPDGASISGTDVVWTPSEAQGPGTYSITVVASDGVAEDSETFSVTVNEINVPPTVDPISDQQVAAGTEVTFTAMATDPDLPANTITWSLGATAPADASIDPATGAFSWTTDGTDVGTTSFDVIASDGTATDAAPVTVFVTEPGAPTVVFASDRDGDYDLWTMSPDGGTPTQLADLPGWDSPPRWSPDGTQIAFVKDGGNTTNGSLWIIDADGSNPTQLSTIQARFAPAWSPDGTQIAFAGNSGDGDFDVHVVAPDGTGLRKVADTPDNETYVAWLDGGILADRDAAAVLVDPATGADLASFSVGNAFSYDAAPDGISVAFGQTSGSGVSRIAILDTTTGTITPVTDGTTSDGGPAWSPDGAELIFNRRPTSTTGDYDLYRIGIDGTGLTRLTATIDNDFTPDWLVLSAPPANQPPVADAGADQTGVVGDTVTLDGTASSDPDDDALTYRWAIESVPTGSTADLVDPTSAAPTLTPDVAGSYNISLVVNDGQVDSVADTVTITATSGPIQITITEGVGVRDTVTVRPPVEIRITEGVGIRDEVAVNPPVEIVISEGIGVRDDVTVNPPVEIVIFEGVGVRDEVAVNPPVEIVISEGIGVADDVTIQLPVEIVITEGVGVRDDVTITTLEEGTVSSGTLQPDGSYEFSGSGFDPGSDIDIGLESEFIPLTTAVADENGEFSVTVTLPPADELPEGFAGEHALVAKGINPEGVPHEVRAAVVVAAPVTLDLHPGNPTDATVGDDPITFTADVGFPSTDLTDETPDLADFAIRLEPIGPGSIIEGEGCDPASGSVGDPSTVTCVFTGIPVNTYTVVAELAGEVFYGRDEAVFTLGDPALGFVTGGGWLPWPDTGGLTSFGFNARYQPSTASAKGSFELVRYLPDGSEMRLEATAIHGLAIATPGSWGTFSGTATYQGPGSTAPAGDHTFIAYLVDTATDDRLWLEVRRPDGAVVEELTIPAPSDVNAVTLGGGNVVLHQRDRGGPKQR